MIELLVKIFQPDRIARVFKGKQNALILIYHAPEADIFEEHLKYLSKYYSFISLEKLVLAIKNQDWSSMPQNALVFTFDDGHVSNYKLLPLFREYNIVPTIYLVSAVVGTKNRFWWQEDLSTAEKESLKRLPNKKRLEVLQKKKSLQTAQSDKIWALTEEQMKEMSSIVDFQSHTKNHPIVTMLDEDELEDELKSPIQSLEDLGQEIRHFAFPNGDYTEREIEYLKQLDYISARTTDIGWNNLRTDVFKLKGMGIRDTASNYILRLQLSGLFGWLLHLKNNGNLNGKKRYITRE